MGDAAGQSVLVLGTGGSARAGSHSHFSIEERKLPSRDAEGAPRLNSPTISLLISKTLDPSASQNWRKRPFPAFPIIVQTTPLGMKPDDPLPLNPDFLGRDQTVFDIVYRPHRTALLIAAEERGCKIIYGMEMLLGQAAAQFELWTGESAPSKVMRKAAEEFLK